MRDVRLKSKRINRHITKINYSVFGAGVGAGVTGVVAVFDLAESVL